MRFISFILGICLCSTSVAQSCLLKVSGVTNGTSFQGKGTCFCIGMTNGDRQLWMTARHNFENVRSAVVIHEGVSYEIPSIKRHGNEDIAIFETDLVDETWGWEFGPAEAGQRIRIPGYGSMIHGGPKVSMVGFIASEQWIDGQNGEHVITGDSGAPVLTADTTVAGVVTGHQTPAIQRTSARSDFAEQRLQTLIVPWTKCRQFVQQHYGGGQCGPQGCGPIWIDPMVVQPRRGITWPSGPPQVIPIARPAPQVYVPQQQQQPSVRSPGSIAEESGSLSAIPFSAVKAAVDSYLRENGEKLRGAAAEVGPVGPPGRPGRDGVDGRDGKDGTNGRDGKDATSKPMTVIFSRGSREITRNTYAPGAPIVIDVEQIFESTRSPGR